MNQEFDVYIFLHCTFASHPHHHFEFSFVSGWLTGVVFCFFFFFLKAVTMDVRLPKESHKKRKEGINMNVTPNQSGRRVIQG